MQEPWNIPGMKLQNPNFAKFDHYAQEIDLLVSTIHSQLSQFENSPTGNGEVALHFLREAMTNTMYLPNL